MLIGKAQPESASPEIATPDLLSLIDVMGEITGVMDDIRRLRACLLSDESRFSVRFSASGSW